MDKFNLLVSTIGFYRHDTYGPLADNTFKADGHFYSHN
jgi:hypothetical protein